MRLQCPERAAATQLAQRGQRSAAMPTSRQCKQHAQHVQQHALHAQQHALHASSMHSGLTSEVMPRALPCSALSSSSEQRI